MKKLILAGFFLFSINLVNAQIKAVTDIGDEVILYQNGTWEYVDESIVEEKEIKLNEQQFIKDEESTFLLKSKKIDIGIWINPKAWSFTKDNTGFDSATEYVFELKEGDLYAMLISEKMEIPMETLKIIAFDNAKSAAPNMKITKEEYRMVNGVKVLMMQMEGTIQGMEITYSGYYYSNENGTIQLLTYTSQKLFDSLKGEIEKMMNGFVELKE